MKRIAILGLALCCALLAFTVRGAKAQTATDLTVTGTVFSASGHALAGAYVYVNGRGARANGSGRYAATVKPAGQIVAIAWALGYAQKAEFLHATGGGSLTGTVQVNFSGAFGLTYALTNQPYRAALTHIPLHTAASVHVGRVRGYAQVPLLKTMYVTPPHGPVRTFPLKTSGASFSGQIRFNGKGAYTVGVYTTTGLPVFEVIIFHGGAATPPRPLNYKPDPPNATPKQLAKLALKLINKARVHAGLTKLHLRPPITRAALAHTADMLSHGYFDIHPHIGSDGSTPIQRVQRTGIRVKRVSEAIGAGPTASLAVANILDSPFHRNIVLGPFRWAGIGSGAQGGLLYMTVDVAA